VTSVSVTYPTGKIRVTVSTVLPVELVYFSGKAVDEQVVLHWQTASESNNRGFEIQRSKDGTSWDEIGFIEGKGTTTEAQDYSFLDQSPLPRINYYRLRQLDFDGKEAFSNIVSIDNRSTQSPGVQIYPNPADDIVNLVFDGFSEEASVAIVDYSGKIVRSVTLEKGRNVLQIDDLDTGFYFVSILSKGERITKRFVVSR